MFPASSKKGGVYMMTAPDVCLTPVPPPVTQAPIPYPNTAQVASTNGAVSKVLIENKETVVEGSKVPSSSGDEPGTKGGVVSGVNRGEVQPKKWSSKVFAQGKKVVHHTSLSAHNGSNANTVGMQTVPSQAKVFVAP